MDVIYLDYNASTPCDPRVVAAMAAPLEQAFANPSSRSHRPGQRASALLEDARSRVARAVGARVASEITFTSGATEANNLALRGLVASLADRGRHLVSQATEHPSVLEPLRHLADHGWELTLLPVDRQGLVEPGRLAAALRPDTVLVSLMLANGETGTVQPVAEVAEIVHAHGALLHCDAAQGLGKIEVSVAALGVDLATFSAHKACGPKGIGALYCRRRRPRLRLEPLLLGGGQEGGLRSGTPNVAAAVGMAAAVELARSELSAESHRIGALRDLLEQRVRSGLDGCTVNGAAGRRLPGTANLSFEGVDGNALLASLPDLAVSSGSACTSAHPEPSAVLQAMGVPRRLAAASIRFSLGRFTTEREVLQAADRIIQEVSRLRAKRPPLASRGD